MTVFLTTQYLEEADRLADDLAIMDRGKIIATGSPEELKATIGTDVVTLAVEGGADEQARAAEVAVGIEGAADVRVVDGSLLVYVKEGARALAPIVLLLNEAGLTVSEVSVSRPTLDDVFLQKTDHKIKGADGA